MSTLFFISATAAGQMITPISPELHSFNSPMVLEYPVDEVFRKAASPTIETQFQNYTCPGVTLERVTFQLIRFEKETLRRLKIVSEVFNKEPNRYVFPELSYA